MTINKDRDALSHIFSFLPAIDLFPLQEVCKSWHEVGASRLTLLVKNVISKTHSSLLYPAILPYLQPRNLDRNLFIVKSSGEEENLLNNLIERTDTTPQIQIIYYPHLNSMEASYIRLPRDRLQFLPPSDPEDKIIPVCIISLISPERPLSRIGKKHRQHLLKNAIEHPATAIKRSRKRDMILIPEVPLKILLNPNSLRSRIQEAFSFAKETLISYDRRQLTHPSLKETFKKRNIIPSSLCESSGRAAYRQVIASLGLIGILATSLLMKCFLCSE